VDFAGLAVESLCWPGRSGGKTCPIHDTRFCCGYKKLLTVSLFFLHLNCNRRQAADKIRKEVKQVKNRLE